MAADTANVTQSMLRKWHEDKFPGLSDAERFSRIFGKWQEESWELVEAIRHLEAVPDDPEYREHVEEEMADVMLTLMALAEFGGFQLTRKAVWKFNENTNRVWVEYTDANGRKSWKRERDNRPDLVGRGL